MKHLKLQTPRYQTLEKTYAEYLKTLHYSQSGTYYMPLHIRDFLHYIENRGITDINQVTDQDISNWINQLKNRKHQRRAGGLSLAHVNKHISALNNFARYLKESQTANIPSCTAYIKDEEERKINIFTIEEIEKLYQSCGPDTLGIRDTAMLSVYYGCGLRKSEGINLNTEDILYNKKLLHVRKSKTGRERLVPVSPMVLHSLHEYVNTARPLLLSGNTAACLPCLPIRQEPALFISRLAKRLSGQGMSLRLNLLKQKAGINTPAGLHTLRHSIATHLLQSGMPLEDISKFLGHQSLESTQLYTHISQRE